MAIPRPVVRAILARDEGMCVLELVGCLGTASCADHRSDRGMGGSKVLNSLECLVAACGLCNGRKTYVTGEERAQLVARGLIVLKGSTHAATRERCSEVPVVYPNGSVFKLTPSGERRAI